ncbi:hypothetical protein [Mycolicibacterium arenosum]|uniref:Secreted protein n=1 Tax=Mycolicibacterium arenosum TaxID=2952157 RepID=A0ABT1LWX9_9MYCO|nr:hypothetical protein [Mycolicibacterium sp. CAU 1645]MCP9271391.1 hypothetical protein [Mycolicibacterium sp. CAU 1645]MCP9271393.1 hypothetical protein [Mycolicibacterium sp. CAU 1645]
MNIVTRRIAAVIALSAAPALIAIGAAATSSAQTTGATNHGSSASHPAFPHQTNAPQPGTSVHHHHQNHRG